MKLSEAIRVGMTYYPQQISGNLIKKIGEDTVGACALGCAYGAMVQQNTGEVPFVGMRSKLYAWWPALKTMVDTECEEGHMLLYEWVCFMNDEKEESREYIADWLEQRGY